jgi:hypothetical protein
MGYRMKNPTYLLWDDSIQIGTFTNTNANTQASTGDSVPTASVQDLTGNAITGPNSGMVVYRVSIDVLQASASGTFWVYYTTGVVPISGKPPGANDQLLAIIYYGTGLFRYKASWMFPVNMPSGSIYLAVSSPTAGSTVSISQFRVKAYIPLNMLKA